MQTLKPAKLDEIVRVMKGVGEVIVPFNFPKVPFNPEDELSIFKSRYATVDGYQIFMHYQKSDYGDYLIQTLQVHNTKAPFLPFVLHSKVARAFLGARHLTLIEIFREGRKVYVWSVCCSRDGDPHKMPEGPEAESCEFEGFSYSHLHTDQSIFF